MDRHALKIDLFFPPQDPTKELSFHTQSLAEALTRKGVLVRVLKPQKLDFKSFYQDIKNHKPDYTLSFNGVLPSDQGLFLCDILQIPHIALLTDYPLYFVQLMQSPLNCLFAQDKASVRFLTGTGAKEAHFLPTAIDKKIVPPLEKKGENSLFCWASSPSSSKLESDWKKRYSKEIIDIIKRACDIALFEPTIDLSEALSMSLQSGSNPSTLKLEELEPLVLLLELEKYMSAIGLERLLTALRGVPITIMPQKELPSDLPELFPEFNHIEEGDVDQFLSFLGKSTALLIADFALKESIPFTTLAAMAMDVLPISFKTQYLSELFPESEPLFFDKASLPSLKEKVEKLLKNYGSQEALIRNNRENIARNFTWDSRIDDLLSILSAKTH